MANNPAKYLKLFDRLLRKAGYVKVGDQAYIHSGGEQLTATISFRKTYLPEIDSVEETLTLFLSDAEHAINSNICLELNKILAAEKQTSFSF